MSGIGRAPAARAELVPSWSTAADDYVVSAQIARSGQWCIIGTSAGSLLRLELATGTVTFHRRAHAGGVLGSSIAPDASRFVTCGQERAARVWTAQGQALCELDGGAAAWVEYVAWSPGGDRIATAAGRSVRIWSAGGELMRECPALDSTVTGLAWRLDGTGLAASCYGGVYVWPLLAGARERHLAWKGSLISLAWSPDARIVACGSQDRSVHFWRLATGQDSQMSGYPLKPKALAWDRESKLLATTGDSTITIWDFRGKGPEGKRPLQLAGHQSACTQLAFGPRASVLASGSQDGSVLLWVPRQGLRAIRYAFLEEEVTALAWHPDQLGLLGADAAGTVTLWAIS